MIQWNKFLVVQECCYLWLDEEFPNWKYFHLCPYSHPIQLIHWKCLESVLPSCNDNLPHYCSKYFLPLIFLISSALVTFHPLLQHFTHDYVGWHILVYLVEDPQFHSQTCFSKYIYMEYMRKWNLAPANWNSYFQFQQYDLFKKIFQSLIRYFFQITLFIVLCLYRRGWVGNNIEKIWDECFGKWILQHIPTGNGPEKYWKEPFMSISM